MKILGISAFYHDSAAALIEGGEIIAAAEEERFSRIKHDSRFPFAAARYCLREAALGVSDLDAVVFYDKPFLKFERLIETYIETAPRGFSSFAHSMPLWLKEKIFLKQKLKRYLSELSPGSAPPPLLFTEHHQAHAASAFFPSPFKSAAVLCIDGVGEWATTSLWHGRDARLEPLKEIHFPHSLGLLYSAFTYYLGFKVNSGEYKVMGLAPYGVPRFKDLILRELIDLKDDGSFRLNMKYFDYATGLRMTNTRFESLLGGPARAPESELMQRDMDIAASVQAVLEDAVVRLARTVQRITGERALCLAGGVALNCVANGRLLREKIFKDIWVQPAAGDSGGAIGAALAAYHQKFERPRILGAADRMRGALLGPAETSTSSRDALEKLGARFETLSEEQILERTASALAQGRVVGWHSGRMEFGPRALGSRSILADPRVKDMREVLNQKIKLREGFRPFAPAVPLETAERYFVLDRASPYMLLVTSVREGQGLPAVTHVDQSARVQTVDPAVNPRFHALLKEFGRKTGTEVLVNTSFNVRGEPLVNTAADSYRCFMHSGLDILVVENHWLEKSAQPAGDWQREIAPD